MKLTPQEHGVLGQIRVELADIADGLFEIDDRDTMIWTADAVRACGVKLLDLIDRYDTRQHAGAKVFPIRRRNP